jgi:hypothetical protein
MKPANYILEELQEIAPGLVQVSHVLPYTVPEGYFELLPDMMLDKVKLPKTQFASVPKGYFESLPELMLHRIREQEMKAELQEIAPTLSGMQRSMPYTVPANYFEALPGKMARRNRAKVVSMQAAMRNRWMQVAAAIIVMLAVFSVWKLNNKSSDISVPAAAMTISNKVETTDTTAEQWSKQLSALDESLLLEKLTESGVPSETRSALYYMNTEDFEGALQDFSAEELTDHLQQIPQTTKNI